MKYQVWIGLIEVVGLENNDFLPTNRGAYVNALAWSHSSFDFIEKVTRQLNEEDFQVIHFEDIEPFKQRCLNCVPEDCIFELASKINEVYLVDFGTFHTHPLDKEE